MKTIITIMIAVAMASLSLPIDLQNTDAFHYAQRRWEGTTVNLCYDTYSLSYLRINGNTNQVNRAVNQLDIARNDWNNQPSRFTLNRIGGQYCNNWVYATNIG
ncbi:MAG: hypothetical protein ACK4FV_06070 [Candidatus Nitrosocaldus sp.]